MDTTKHRLKMMELILHVFLMLINNPRKKNNYRKYLLNFVIPMVVLNVFYDYLKIFL